MEEMHTAGDCGIPLIEVIRFCLTPVVVRGSFITISCLLILPSIQTLTAVIIISFWTCLGHSMYSQAVASIVLTWSLLGGRQSKGELGDLNFPC
jgi:hypothetical protein